MDRKERCGGTKCCGGSQESWLGGRLRMGRRFADEGVVGITMT